MLTTLRGKIFTGYAVIVAIHLVVTLWSINTYSRESNKTSATLLEHAKNASALLEFSSNLALQHRLTLSDQRTDSTDRRSRSVDASQLQLLDRLVEYVDAPQGEIVALADSYRRLQAELPIERRTDPLDIDEVTARITSVRKAVVMADRGLLRTARSAQDRAAASISSTLYGTTIASIIAAVLGLVVAVGYSRWAVRSIDRLRAAVRNVGDRELTQKIHITSADELGDLSFEFNRMIEQLNRYEQLNLDAVLIEQRRADTILQSIDTPILVLDASRNVVTQNRAAAALRGQLYGIDAGSPDGTLPLSFLNEADDHEHVDIVELELEGIDHLYQLSVHRLAGPDALSVVLLTDVTRYAELERVRNDILARVSHELRTPLSSIVIGIDLVGQGLFGKLDDPGADQIARMKDDARRLRRMIDGILEAARIADGAERDSSTIQDPASFVEDLGHRFRAETEARGIDLLLQIDPEDLTGLSVPGQDLTIVLDNLMSNAIAFTPAGRTIEISSSASETAVTLLVSDEGIGIPLDAQPRLFERFFQVERGEKQRPGSIGLGLSVVRDLVEQNGGRISVQSRPNEGAVFTVTLPRSAE